MTFLESTATLRATGGFRYVSAAFLTVWLVGWAIGEAVALSVIAVLIASTIPALAGLPISTATAKWFSAGAHSFVLLFLLIWLTLWTFGGIAAITRLLRDLAGEDRLHLLPAGLELTRRAGPFRRVRVIDRAAIRRIRVRHHDKALVADTSSGSRLLTDLGTLDGRTSICRWLRDALHLSDDDAAIDIASPPPGWEVQVGEDGYMQLRRLEQRARPMQALILWCVTALVTLGWIAGMRVDVSNRPGFTAYVLTLGLVAGSAWLTWGRSLWLVRPGRLAFRRQFGPWISERPFEHAQLAVECSNDSDGDDAYSLIVRAGSDHRTIHRVVNDDGEIVDCARWLAAHTGFPLVGGAVKIARLKSGYRL
jgi:hypothetical protein